MAVDLLSREAVAKLSPQTTQEEVAAWIHVHDAELAPFRGLEDPSVEATLAKDRNLVALLSDAGWLRLGWPEDVGGLGGSALLRAAVYEQLGESGVRIPELCLFAEVMGPPMVRYAPHLARQHLVPMLRGDEVWGQGFSEPEAGSDLASLRTRAVETADGFVLTGQKVWTSGGQCATHYVVLARSGEPASGHSGLSMFFVDRSSPGVETRAIHCATDRNDLSETFFDEVVVPREHTIGGVGEGWAVAMFLLQFERGMYAWQRQATLHTRFRHLLSRPDLPDDLISAGRLGEVQEALFALRVRCARTVRLLAAGESPGAATSVDKVLIAAAEQLLMDVARELLDPVLELGDDEDVASWRWEWWYSRPASIYGGAGEVQRNIIAERILGLPR